MLSFVRSPPTVMTPCGYDTGRMQTRPNHSPLLPKIGVRAFASPASFESTFASQILDRSLDPLTCFQSEALTTRRIDPFPSTKRFASRDGHSQPQTSGRECRSSLSRSQGGRGSLDASVPSFEPCRSHTRTLVPPSFKTSRGTAWRNSGRAESPDPNSSTRVFCCDSSKRLVVTAA